MNFFKLRDDDDDDDEEETSLVKKDKVDVSWERILWKKLIECFDPEVDSNGMGMVLYVPLRVFISMFLIPFWLLLGILSAGWLWPPQVREGLFVVSKFAVYVDVDLLLTRTLLGTLSYPVFCSLLPNSKK